MTAERVEAGRAGVRADAGLGARGADGDAAVPGPRVFIFPHAGGRASVYRQWWPRLAERADLVPVSLPPPDRRVTEHGRAGLTTLASGLAEAVRHHSDPARPSGPVFIGHSLGALLAFETARLLADEAATRPALLVLSAFPAPDRLPPPSEREARSRYDDERLAAELKRLGGDVDEVLAHPELRELVLGAFRADLELYESYQYRPGPALRCPLVLLAGRDDTVSAAELAGWGRLAQPLVREHWFPGGHSFVQDLAAEVESVIIDALALVPGTGPARGEGAV